MNIVEDDFVLIHAPSLPTISASPFGTRGKGSSCSPPPQARELTWLIGSLRSTLRQLKHGLEECYALLAPVDGPGSTLALTTPRHETVKGHVTRVGARLVRGAVSLRLRTLPPQTLCLSPARPIRLAPLAALHALLTRSVDLLALCLSYEDGQGSLPRRSGDEALFLATQLRALAQNLTESSAILKGAPPPSSASFEFSLSSAHRPGSSASASGPTGVRALELGAGASAASGSWTTHSASLWHFSDAAPVHAHATTTTRRNNNNSNNLSVYLTVEDASLVLYVRALEPADAPMNFGAKLAFAIGTARRIEHDEAERVFRYACDDESRPGGGGDGTATPSSTTTSTTTAIGTGAAGSGKGYWSGGSDGDRGSVHDDGEEETRRRRHLVDVYVREKVRVESPDPSLLSLSAKLGALSNTLALARRNLAAVMGEEFED
ncbi:hypothetical protein DL767_000636 [Monosporascus sp. MG133]|nr:hypothetical protein DL767_000636 [Monosporascus sp. MG133]